MDDVFAQYSAALAKGHQAAIEGRPKDALAAYREAARVAPERPLPHVCIGGVLLRTGRSQEASEAYGQALELDPHDRAALSGKLSALRAAGSPEEATAIEARLEELDRREAERDREAAEEAEMRELERSGALPRPELMYITGERALLSGRAEAAVDAWLEGARGYAAAGHPDAALESAQRALLVDPGAPHVHLELARLYLLRGWTDRAVERLVLLDRLLVLAPDPSLHAALRALAGEHADRSPALASLAGDHVQRG